MITFFVYGKKYYRNQPDDVDIVHGYILFCNGQTGQLHQEAGAGVHRKRNIRRVALSLRPQGQDRPDPKHSYVSIAAMPYITSQFMPRRVDDRPQVIPDGCVSLACIGQFVETPADVSFTVESSVRTAMMAVWGLTGLEKPMVPMCEPLFDMRVIAKSLKMAAGTDTLSLEILDKVKSSTGGSIARLLEGAVSHMPDPDVF